MHPNKFILNKRIKNGGKRGGEGRSILWWIIRASTLSSVAHAQFRARKRVMSRKWCAQYFFLPRCPSSAAILAFISSRTWILYHIIPCGSALLADCAKILDSLNRSLSPWGHKNLSTVLFGIFQYLMLCCDSSIWSLRFRFPHSARNEPIYVSLS